MTKLPHCFFVLLLLSCFVSCTDRKTVEWLGLAESMIETKPDSAFAILKEIDKSKLGTKDEEARYALLMSMALDKSYIDTTTFDVLQPAIDYYLKKGDADQRLRTYYYQGRIYQNRGDGDNALNSFAKAIDLAPECHDSLVLARALVSQGTTHYAYYDFESYLNDYCRAAAVYKTQNHGYYEFDCLLNALNGSILLGDKQKSDSLLALCNQFRSLDEEQYQSLLWYRFAHAIEYGSAEEIEEFINTNKTILESNVPNKLNLALAYNKLGDNNAALSLLKTIPAYGADLNSLKHKAISVQVLRGLGDYKGAFDTYMEFCTVSDSIDVSKFNHRLNLLSEKHALELKAEIDAKNKLRIIWGCIGGLALLAAVVVILMLSIRAHRVQKARLTLEKHNLQLERDMKAVEAENLAHRVEALENERETLRELADRNETLPPEVRKAILVRLEMLNSVLAGSIADNNKYVKPYDDWVKEITEDTEAFMDSNRLAFQVSHPQFIRHLEERGLTTKEINYACLYALGLNGREIGAYMRRPSHIHMSSAIRKKLDLDKRQAILSNYLRQLLNRL